MRSLRARLAPLLAALVACALVLGFAPSPAGAATVVDNGLHMQQYVQGNWPLIALVDHTSQNPLYWHVKDVGYPRWQAHIGDNVGQYERFQLTDDCSAWPNRVCVEFAERDLSVPGSLNSCTWPGKSTQIGQTCWFVTQPNGRVVKRVTIVMATNQRGDTSAVRTAATTHELGHSWGLGHSDNSTYLMYPTTDGDPGSPRGDEYGCVFQIYIAPPCSAAASASAAPRTALAPVRTGRGDYPAGSEELLLR